MKHQILVDFEVDRGSGIPLYAQIRDAIRLVIKDSNLLSGNRLPAVITLASRLGVTPATVLRAYEELVQEGRVVSQVGRGTFVAEPDVSVADDAPGLAPSSPRGGAPRGSDRTEAVRRVRRGVARSLEALNTLADRPGLIRFNAGIPDTSLVDQETFRRLAAEATESDEWDLQSYPPAGGLPELRELIAARLGRPGRPLTLENILITNGCQQGVALVAQEALESRRRILCEMPSYAGLSAVFDSFGHWVESVMRDPEGPLLSRLEALRGLGPSVLYLCPELNNPQGTDLSPERRAFLLDWAEQEDVVLLSDEVSRELRFDGAGPESLLTDAGSGRALLAGSISKSYTCGLRIGWLAGSRSAIRALTSLKHTLDIGCPALTQAVAALLLRSGEYDRHLTRVRSVYRERCAAALEALTQTMPDGVTWTRPAGGFHIWVELPAGYSSLALFLLAIERGVAILPGPQLDIDHRFLNAFRLSVGILGPEQIAEGVGKLGEAIRELLSHPPGEPGLAGLGDFV